MPEGNQIISWMFFSQTDAHPKLQIKSTVYCAGAV